MIRHILSRRWAAPLITLVLASLAGRSEAEVVADVTASIGSYSAQSAGTSPLDTGAVGPDARNLARAVANPLSGSVGVGVTTDLFGGTVASVQAYSHASLQEDWTAAIPAGGGIVDCVTVACPVPATVQFSLHGVLSPNFGNPNTANVGGLFAQLDVGDLEVQVQADQPDPFAPDLFALVKRNGALVSAFAVPTTVLADGSFLLNDTLSFQVGLLDQFTSSLFLSADWSGEGSIAEPTSADLLDTGSFDIVSSDPNVVWISDSGRTSSFAGSPSSAVPEPNALTLTGLGLLGIACGQRGRRRRGRTAPGRACNGPRAWSCPRPAVP